MELARDPYAPIDVDKTAKEVATTIDASNLSVPYERVEQVVVELADKATVTLYISPLATNLLKAEASHKK